MKKKILEDQVLNIITENHKSTNGKCGIGIVKIATNLKVSSSIIKTIINALYKTKKVSIKQGINHKLIFLKT
jgi:hypothetical protein